MLAAEVERVTLAMPGASIPGMQLAAAGLPPLAEMLRGALDGSCDYRRGALETKNPEAHPCR